MFRTKVRSVIAKHGFDADAWMHLLDDNDLEAITGIKRTADDTSERTENRRQCQKGYTVVNIGFTGFDPVDKEDTPYVRMDPIGFQKSLQNMYEKDECIITAKKIYVEISFGLENPRTVCWRTDEIWTRAAFAKKLAQEYQMMFRRKQMYHIWVAHLEQVHIFCLWYDPRKNAYCVEGDIQ